MDNSDQEVNAPVAFENVTEAQLPVSNELPSDGIIVDTNDYEIVNVEENEIEFDFLDIDIDPVTGKKLTEKEKTKRRYSLAVAAYMDGQFQSLDLCAKTYKVKKTTLYRMIKDPERQFVGSGNVSKVLTKEEEKMISDHVTERMQIGCGLDILQIRFVWNTINK